MVTEADVCEQLTRGSYLAVERPGVEPATSRSLVRHAAVRLPISHQPHTNGNAKIPPSQNRNRKTD